MILVKKLAAKKPKQSVLRPSFTGQSLLNGIYLYDVTEDESWSLF